MPRPEAMVSVNEISPKTSKCIALDLSIAAYRSGVTLGVRAIVRQIQPLADLGWITGRNIQILRKGVKPNLQEENESPHGNVSEVGFIFASLESAEKSMGAP